MGVEGCFSDWKSVTRGNPQELMLGHLMFVSYFNNLDTNMRSMRLVSLSMTQHLLVLWIVREVVCSKI